MKKSVITVWVILLTIFSTTAQDKYHCTSEECDFKSGDTVFLFGDDVKLRALPDTESKVIKLLNIGSELEILEKTQFSWPYHGFDSPFYKVRYQNKTGYILGALISLEKKTLNGTDYLFSFMQHDDNTFLKIRKILLDGSYIETKVRLTHTEFGITTMNNMGISGINGVLFIDYYAEACGVQGGGIYFFEHEGRLVKVAELSQVSDAGVFYHWEEFIFPSNKKGVPGKILYKKEVGEYYDEATNWSKTTTEMRELAWEDGKLIPNYKEIKN